jgi:hypothetical protein
MLLCERCAQRGKQTFALRGERFCWSCRRNLFNEMADAGYLTRVPPLHHRYEGSCEDREQHLLQVVAADNPWWDNLTRAYEEDH